LDSWVTQCCKQLRYFIAFYLWARKEFEMDFEEVYCMEIVIVVEVVVVGMKDVAEENIVEVVVVCFHKENSLTNLVSKVGFDLGESIVAMIPVDSKDKRIFQVLFISPKCII
jgi:hypothetical protein